MSEQIQTQEQIDESLAREADVLIMQIKSQENKSIIKFCAGVLLILMGTAFITYVVLSIPNLVLDIMVH